MTIVEARQKLEEIRECWLKISALSSEIYEMYQKRQASGADVSEAHAITCNIHDAINMCHRNLKDDVTINWLAKHAQAKYEALNEKVNALMSLALLGDGR